MSAPIVADDKAAKGRILRRNFAIPRGHGDMWRDAKHTTQYPSAVEAYAS